MLDQVVRGTTAHSVKNHVYAFPPCKLGGWNKITIRRDHHNLIDLLLEGHGGDIQTKPHIDTLLNDIQFKIIISRRSTFGACLPCFPDIMLWSPSKIVIETSEAQSHLSDRQQVAMQGKAKLCLWRFGKIDRAIADRTVHLLHQRRTVIEEYSIKRGRFFWPEMVVFDLLKRLPWPDSLGQMPSRQIDQAKADCLGIICVKLREAGTETTKEVGPVDHNRCWHSIHQIKVVPGIGLELMSAFRRLKTYCRGRDTSNMAFYGDLSMSLTGEPLRSQNPFALPSTLP